MNNSPTRSIILRWLSPTAALIIILIIMMYNFSNQNVTAANNTVTRNIANLAQDGARVFDEQLTLLKQVGKPIAALLGDESTLGSEYSGELAEVARKYSDAYEVWVCGADGTGINHAGEQVTLNGLEYQDEIQSLERVAYVYAANDGINGESAIITVVPIVKKGILGHLLLYYSLDNFDALVNQGDFAIWDMITMIDVDGNIIYTSGTEEYWRAGNNLFEELQGNNADAAVRIQRGIRSKSSATVPIHVGDTDDLLVHTPVTSSEWILVVGVSQDYIDRLILQQYKSSQSMLYEIVIVIIIFICIIAGVNVVSKLYSRKKQQQLEIKADTDLLTGLNNKLATERKIKEFIADNPDAQSMMFVLDIDNFKKINDTMGHAFGDVVLSTLGHSIGPLFRATDIIGRAGGDEFIIFLKNITTPEAVRGEAKKVENFFKDFKAGEYTKYSATASIGVAIYPQEGADFESIYKAADQALYKAKKRGKNQLAFYKDEWAEPSK